MISFIGMRQDRNPRSEDFPVEQVRMRNGIVRILIPRVCAGATGKKARHGHHARA